MLNKSIGEMLGINNTEEAKIMDLVNEIYRLRESIDISIKTLCERGNFNTSSTLAGFYLYAFIKSVPIEFSKISDREIRQMISENKETITIGNQLKINPDEEVKIICLIRDVYIDFRKIDIFHDSHLIKKLLEKGDFDKKSVLAGFYFKKKISIEEKFLKNFLALLRLEPDNFAA